MEKSRTITQRSSTFSPDLSTTPSWKGGIRTGSRAGSGPQTIARDRVALSARRRRHSHRQNLTSVRIQHTALAHFPALSQIWQWRDGGPDRAGLGRTTPPRLPGLPRLRGPRTVAAPPNHQVRFWCFFVFPFDGIAFIALPSPRTWRISKTPMASTPWPAPARQADGSRDRDQAKGATLRSATGARSHEVVWWCRLATLEHPHQVAGVEIHADRASLRGVGSVQHASEGRVAVLLIADR